jgi:Protein of unknown function (DUF3306)
MNDPDNFLSRWSRRKRGADADTSRTEGADVQPGDRAPPPADPTRPAAKEEVGHPPAFDVTSLPPLESIGAGTDISPFMQTGVPTALRHAALRRAWTADPAIKDYVGLNENFWDAAGPDGVIPGFGELDPGLDVKRMVAELFGETAPDKPEAEQRASAPAPAQSDENLEMPDNRDIAANPAPPQSAPQQNENAATQKKTAQGAQAAPEPTMQKMTRRHGGAMPE